MNPLKAILEEVMQPDSDLASLLRKARVVGELLDIPELVEWSRWELEGYPEGVSVPDYRRLPFTLVATVWTPRGLASIPLPSHCFQKRPEDTERVQDVKSVLGAAKWGIRASLGTVEGWQSASASGLVHFSLDRFLPEMAEILRACVNDPYRKTIQQLHAQLDIASLKGISAGVRNKLLELVLLFKRTVPDLLEDLDLSARSDKAEPVRETVRLVVNVSQDVRVTQTQNLNLLIDELQRLGVNPEDLAELREVLDREDQRGVVKWLSRVVDTLAEQALPVVVRAVLQHFFSG